MSLASFKLGKPAVATGRRGGTHQQAFIDTYSKLAFVELCERRKCLSAISLIASDAVIEDRRVFHAKEQGDG